MSRKEAGTKSVRVSHHHPVDLGSPYPTMKSGTGMSGVKGGKFFLSFHSSVRFKSSSEISPCYSSKYLMNNPHTEPWGLQDNKDMGFDFKEFI